MPAKGSIAAALVAVAGALTALACGSDEPSMPASSPVPDATATASPDPTPTPAATTAATASPTATATAAPSAPAEDADALASELAALALAPAIAEFGESADELTALAFPLDVRDERGRLWAVVTNGPQPFREDADGNGVNFFHFAALYRRNAGGSWSEPLARVTLETAPMRTHTVEALDPGPREGRGAAALIAILGFTGAHSGTFDVLLAEGERLTTVASHISASAYSGELADLDGDGITELVFNSTDPYVFCYACAVAEMSEQVHRWNGAAYEAVTIEAPAGLDGDLGAAAERVARLARANLWRDAAALAVETSRRAPEHDGLRWLSIVVNRTAALRLGHAGSPGQPLLTNVLAGEYGAAYALMRALPPEEAFALNGPLITDTAAQRDLPSMVAYLLFYAEGALRVRDDDPAIHAVRALGEALASPDDLTAARASIGRALELAPGDPFLREARAYLESVEAAPGLP